MKIVILQHFFFVFPLGTDASSFIIIAEHIKGGQHAERQPCFCVERMTTVEFIERHKIITICRKVYGDPLLKLAEALYAGGLKLMEMTFDQQDPACLDKTAEAIRAVKERVGNDMLIGAGTVLTPSQVIAAKQAGAKYIISPNTDPHVIEVTKHSGLASIPGAMTPSEIISAHHNGADIVKLFPATYLGFDYIKDILGPISNVKLCATGGVNEENAPKYLEMGFSALGIGGRLCDKKCIAAGDYNTITARAKIFTALINEGK